MEFQKSNATPVILLEKNVSMYVCVSMYLLNVRMYVCMHVCKYMYLTYIYLYTHTIMYSDDTISRNISSLSLARSHSVRPRSRLQKMQISHIHGMHVNLCIRGICMFVSTQICEWKKKGANISHRFECHVCVNTLTQTHTQLSYTPPRKASTVWSLLPNIQIIVHLFCKKNVNLFEMNISFAKETKQFRGSPKDQGIHCVISSAKDPDYFTSLLQKKCESFWDANVFEMYIFFAKET